MLERVFRIATSALAAFVALIFAWMLTDILSKGLAQISFDFIFDQPTNSGRSGGIASIIVATLWTVSIAVLAAIPIGLAAALWLSEFSERSHRFKHSIRLVLDVLAGVPSIVYGLFGNALFVFYFGFGYSILAGGLTLACMILPIFIRTCEQGISNVRQDWRMGAAALGMRQSSAIVHVILPAAMPSICVGLVLGVGRATAETAALLFTSGYVDRMPTSVLDSGRVLSVHIYDLTMNITGGDKAAYGSAIVLIAMIVLFNVITYALSRRWLHEHKPCG